MSAESIFDLPEAERPRLVGLLAKAGGSASVAIRAAGCDVELPPTAGRAVLALLEQLAVGSAVHLVPADAELTTQEAANLLGISRTYVARLVDTGRLPAHRVGSHRRLRGSDVLAYKARRAERLAGARAITGADTATGVPYR